MARQDFTSGLEGLRLCSPKDFWRLLKAPHQPTRASPDGLHAHYATLLATIPAGFHEEEWLPLPLAGSAPILSEEVAAAATRLRCNKALGGSWLSAELLRQHAHPGIYSALAALFN